MSDAAPDTVLPLTPPSALDVSFDATLDGTTADAWCQTVAAGAVLVTANQRLSRHYLEAYQRWRSVRDDPWWETPRILPLASWLAALHERALVDGRVDRVLMPELVERQCWQRALDADVGLSPLLDVDAAARQARTAWQTARAWRVSSTLDTGGSADQQAFSRWVGRFVRDSRSTGRIDAASATDEVIELIVQGAMADALPANVLMAGFLRLSRQSEQVIDALRAAGCTVLQLAPMAQATAVRRCHADDSTELIGVATAVRGALEDDPTAELGVVIPNLGQQRDRVLRTFDQVFFPGMSPGAIAAAVRPYDISLGTSLIDEPVVQAAWLDVKLALAGLQGTEIPAWLLSPYLLAADADAESRQQLDRRLRERPATLMRASTLRASLPGDSVLAAALRKLERIRLPTATGGAVWASVLAEMLRALDWPGRLGVASVEYQAAQAVHRCLDDLQLLDDGEKLAPAAVLGQFRRLLVERIFQPESPSVPVQILGRLESHGIAFDRLWVTGLDAEQWPPETSPSALLDIRAQRKAGVPEAAAESRLALALDEWRLWCASAPRVDASVALSRDGNALMPAVVITGLPDDTAPIDVPSPPARRIADTASLVSVPDTHGPALAAGTAVRGGARLLENQALCPFRAFASHRLGIRPLEEASPGLDRRQQGTVLHRVLELFWQQVNTHAALVELTESGDVEAVLRDAIDAALAEQTIDEALQGLERERLGRLVGEWLSSRELPREPFRVIAFEAEHSVDREGVCMNLKVDRVDQLESGQSVVIDYKTGTSNSTRSWSEERIESPQLPLYALTDEAIEGVYFGEVVRHRPRFLGVASEAGLLDTGRPPVSPFESWSDWRTHWQASIDAVAREIRNGLATVTPTKSACTYCDLPPLCRVDLDATAKDREAGA